MEKRIVKILVASMLILTLTIVNFIAVGTEIISYAADGGIQMSQTNHKNVSFGAYLLNDQGEKLSEQDIDINNQEIKLGLKVEVNKEGYFNGQVVTKNANFEFVSSQSEFVNNVTSDTLTLNQINAGSNPEIEVIVKPTVTENFNLSLLNMTSQLELTGIYKDKTERNIKITGKSDVKMNYVSTNVSEDSVVNNVEVITNKAAVYDGEEKRVVQVKVELGLLNNTYPVKHLMAKVDVPQLGEVQIVDKATTNSMPKYKYSYDNNTVKIDYDNPAKDNHATWKKAGNEEVVLTYIYDKDVKIDENEITSTVELELYDGKQINAKDAKTILSQNEEKDGIVTLKENVDSEIYKGKLYAGVEKQYTSKTTIEVNLAKVAQTLTVNEHETSIPSEYRTTTVNKNELLTVLGEEGKLEILTVTANGKQSISTITKSSNEDENGNVIVTYPEGVTNIEIRTNNPQTNKNINLVHTKAIKPLDREAAKATTEISMELEGMYDVRGENPGTIGKISSTSELKETLTEATVEANKLSLSTLTENKSVEITATLNTTSEKNDLYKNPVVQIELPEQVIATKINSINVVNGEEFAIASQALENINNRQVITVALSGAQTDYKPEPTQIVISADLTLNNRATSAEESINMTYTNENVNQYKDGAAVGTATTAIQVVSPKGIIAVNSINALEIETLGEEQKVSKELEMSAEAKQVKVEKEIINNNQGKVENVAMLGNFATDSNENNLHATLTTPLSLEGNATQVASVYYTDNENATEDLNNPENGWKQEATSNSKKYLVTVPQMEATESLKVSYDMQIPENLQANQKANEGYEVKYTQESTGVEQKVEATDIELSTKQTENNIANIPATGDITVKVVKDPTVGGTGEDDGILVGSNVPYTAMVRNNTDQEMKNVKLTWDLPNEVEIISQSIFDDVMRENLLNPEYQFKDGDIKQVSNDKEVTIESIPAKSIVDVYAILEAKEISDATKSFDITATVKYQDKTYTSSTKSEVQNNKLFTATLSANKENGEVKAGDTIDYTIKVKNQNAIDRNDLMLTDTIPAQLSVKSIKVGTQEQKATSNDVAIPLNLAAGEEKQVTVSTVVDYEAGRTQNELISNEATLTSMDSETKTNKVEHEIVPSTLGGETGNTVSGGSGNTSTGTSTSSPKPSTAPTSTTTAKNGYAQEDPDKAADFDLKLEKYITKVVVKSSKGNQTYDYNNAKIAKVELHRNIIEGATVVVEYRIVVTNEGGVAGYVKNIADYLPNDLKFSSELNKDWYQEGSSVFNNTLGNKKLQPGESAEVKLTLTKVMTQENIGRSSNIAEIAEDYNEQSLKDKDSTPKNKVQGEDDMSSADVIISIGTGGPVVYGTLLAIMIGIAAIIVVFINKEKALKESMKKGVK